MNTLPHTEQREAESKSVRMRADIWEAARQEAFNRKTSISRVLDEVLRAHFGLPTTTATDEADAA